MLQRIITAIVLLIYAFGLVTLGVWYPIAVDVLIYTFMLLGLYEILHSFKVSGYNVYRLVPLLVGIAIFPMAYFFDLVGIVITLVIGIVMMMVMYIFTKTRVLNDLFASIFAMIYPTLFMALAFYMTKTYASVYIASFIILVPIITDAFAYFAGRLIGGPKLCPTISPKKTIAGAVGGVIGGTLAAACVYLFFDYYAVLRDFFTIPRLAPDFTANIVVYIVIGFIGSIICQLGDLFASRIKRSIGIKDFGKIFPGHGGCLDRLDSIMFMLVFLFVVFSCINF